MDEDLKNEPRSPGYVHVVTREDVVVWKGAIRLTMLLWRFGTHSAFTSSKSSSSS